MECVEPLCLAWLVSAVWISCPESGGKTGRNPQLQLLAHEPVTPAGKGTRDALPPPVSSSLRKLFPPKSQEKPLSKGRVNKSGGFWWVRSFGTSGVLAAPAFRAGGASTKLCGVQY